MAPAKLTKMGQRKLVRDLEDGLVLMTAASPSMVSTRPATSRVRLCDTTTTEITQPFDEQVRQRNIKTSHQYLLYPKQSAAQTKASRPLGKCRATLASLFLLVLATGCCQALLINVRAREERPHLRLVESGRTGARLMQVNSTNHHQIRHLFKRATGEKRAARLLEVDALQYLQRYGYMNSTGPNANLISEDSFSEAIMSFQRFAGLPETGSIDGQTVTLMQMPRCGNRDHSGKSEEGRRRRKKRYALQGSKWRRQELTYRISQYPSRFLHKKHEVDSQIEKAFKIWSQVTPIEFVVKRDGRVHIDIRFASGEHGDGDPFDGPGNTLAHAYFPQYGGDAHFDDQEYWTVDSYAGTNIFQVAAHELGHSLGLGHSSVREALMAPFYQKYKPNFKLHADDVLAIQALYGEKSSGSDGPDSTNPIAPPPISTSTSTTTTTTSTPTSEPTPPRPSNRGAVDLCQDAKIDAITRTEDGNTYVFRGQHYWLVTNDGLASGYPARISRDWDGLPGNLDAALTWSDGKTFFFKGDKYWRFLNKRPEPGYPKLISAGFAGIPNNVDAAFVWSGNGKTYFFKRDKYWRFDSKQEPPVSSQYPKSIKNWVGLPASGIDAAFKWENGMTYFFKDDLYFRFDDREFEVDTSSRPAFPRSTAEWWFGCTNSNLPLLAGSTRSGSTSGSTEHQGRNEGQVALNQIHYHRRPAIDLDSADSKVVESSEVTPKPITSTPKPTGSSISRSIFSTLSALFLSSLTGGDSSNAADSPSNNLISSSQTPSTSATSNSTPTGSFRARSLDSTDDWSIHRGIGEEVRRLLARTRQLEAAAAAATAASNRKPQPSSGADNSRWSFPLGGSSGTSISGTSSGREQSSSELRMPSSLSNPDR